MMGKLLSWLTKLRTGNKELILVRPVETSTLGGAQRIVEALLESDARLGVQRREEGSSNVLDLFYKGTPIGTLTFKQKDVKYSSVELALRLSRYKGVFRLISITLANGKTFLVSENDLTQMRYYLSCEIALVTEKIKELYYKGPPPWFRQGKRR